MIVQLALKQLFSQPQVFPNSRPLILVSVYILHPVMGLLKLVHFFHLFGMKSATYLKDTLYQMNEMDYDL